jgi:hypothetical protein
LFDFYSEHFGLLCIPERRKLDLQRVIPSAKPEFISLGEQHGKDNIRKCDSVHIYFWTKQRMTQARIEPSQLSLFNEMNEQNERKIASKCYAIDISLCIDTCNIAYGIAIPASHFPFSGHSLENAIAPQKSPMP